MGIGIYCDFQLLMLKKNVHLITESSKLALPSRDLSCVKS